MAVHVGDSATHIDPTVYILYYMPLYWFPSCLCSFPGGEPCGQNESGPKKTVDVRADRRHISAAGVQDAHVPGTRTPDHVHDAERRKCYFRTYVLILYVDIDRPYGKIFKLSIITKTKSIEISGKPIAIMKI